MLMTAKGLCVKAIERLLPQDDENHSGIMGKGPVQWARRSLQERCWRRDRAAVTSREQRVSEIKIWALGQSGFRFSQRGWGYARRAPCGPPRRALPTLRSGSRRQRRSDGEVMGTLGNVDWHAGGPDGYYKRAEYERRRTD